MKSQERHKWREIPADGFTAVSLFSPLLKRCRVSERSEKMLDQNNFFSLLLLPFVIGGSKLKLEQSGVSLLQMTQGCTEPNCDCGSKPGVTLHFLCRALSNFQDFSFSALLVSYLLQHIMEETYVMCSLSWALLMQRKSLSLMLQ